MTGAEVTAAEVPASNCVADGLGAALFWRRMPKVRGPPFRINTVRDVHDVCMQESGIVKSVLFPPPRLALVGSHREACGETSDNCSSNKKHGPIQ